MHSSGKRPPPQHQPSRDRPQQSPVPPRAPGKRPTSRAFPTRFSGGDDGLLLIRKQEDGLLNSIDNGVTTAEERTRGPGIAKRMKTKAQSKIVSRKRKTGNTAGRSSVIGDDRIPLSSPPPGKRMISIARPLERWTGTSSRDTSIQPQQQQGSDPSSRSDEIQTTSGPSQGSPEARKTRDVVQVAPATSRTNVAESAGHINVLAPETPGQTSLTQPNAPTPRTPSRPRLRLQLESTGDNPARNELPFTSSGRNRSKNEASLPIKDGIPGHVVETDPSHCSPPTDKIPSRPTSPRLLPDEQEENHATFDPAGNPQYEQQLQSSPSDSLSCIVYCWHGSSQSLSQGQATSSSQPPPQTHTLPPSQSQPHSQPHPHSQPSPIITTSFAHSQNSRQATQEEDKNRALHFFQGMENQSWVPMDLSSLLTSRMDHLDPLRKQDQGQGQEQEQGSESESGDLYTLRIQPPSRDDVLGFCQWDRYQ